MKKQYIWVIAFILILGGIIVFSHRNQNVVSNNSIHIAFIGPLTGDGAAWGEIEWNTIQLAVDEINKAGGINGKMIGASSEDTKCDGQLAVSATQKLINVDKIHILLVSCSQEILAIAPITEKAKVLVFTPFANASEITDAGEYIFRNAISNTQIAASMAAVAKKIGGNTVALSEQSAFSTNLKNLFVQEYEAQGGKVASDQEFAQEAKDYRTQITKMLAEKPNVVVLIPNGPATGLPALKQLREFGYNGKIVSNFFGESKEVQQSQEAQGLIYVSDPIIPDSTSKKTLFENYKTRFGSYPDLEWAASGFYDAMYILKDSIGAVGDDPTALKNYLYAMPNFDGVLGSYRFDAGGDMTGVSPSVFEIKNFTSIPYTN